MVFIHSRDERPQGFEKEHNDCTVRTLVRCTGIPYKLVHDELAKFGRKQGKGIAMWGIARIVFKRLLLNAVETPAWMTVNQFIKKHPKGTFYCLKRGHVFSIQDGVAYDLSGMRSRINHAWEIQKFEDTEEYKEMSNEAYVEEHCEVQ